MVGLTCYWTRITITTGLESVLGTMLEQLLVFSTQINYTKIPTLVMPSPFLSTLAELKTEGTTLWCNRLSPLLLTTKSQGNSVGCWKNDMSGYNLLTSLSICRRNSLSLKNVLQALSGPSLKGWSTHSLVSWPGGTTISLTNWLYSFRFCAKVSDQLDRFGLKYPSSNFQHNALNPLLSGIPTKEKVRPLHFLFLSTSSLTIKAQFTELFKVNFFRR